MLRKLFSKKQAPKPSRPAFRPEIEGLEERAVPAAGVITNSGLGILQIFGDAGDSVHDRISITSDTNGNVVVSGVGTTVDGVASKTFTDVSQLFIDTGTGNDHVTVDNVSLGGFFAVLQVNTGDGNDQVDLMNVSDASFFSMNIGINTGSGNDVVNVDTALVFGSISINTGSGNDVIDVDMASALAGFFGGSISINAGADNDQVTISNLTAQGGFFGGGTLSVDGGDGNDLLHDDGGNSASGGISFSDFEKIL